jgi:hypothetical protein
MRDLACCPEFWATTQLQTSSLRPLSADTTTDAVRWPASLEPMELSMSGMNVKCLTKL